MDPLGHVLSEALGNSPDNPEEHKKEHDDAINNTVSVIELFQRLVSGEPEDVDEFFDAYDEWIDDLEQAEMERLEEIANQLEQEEEFWGYGP